MGSLIPGYEYDIFISYRQKDNKHDGWVTEFVNNLKGELESTFKEDISVYFDINPHDGLLEAHDVDASLQDKLKCLVFIPIISRTYCDPKSFAWEHEFKAFIDLASKDRFGLKVKLPNGNVATRILPVQIHDINPNDRSLIEKELGGHLRAIEFIYKESGINRPLKPDDDEKINLNRTKYLNQINKTANVIDEIISGLKDEHILMTEKIPVSGVPSSELHKGELEKESGNIIKSAKSRLISMGSLLTLLIIAAVLFIPKLIRRDKFENLRDDDGKISVAVIPFENLTGDTTFNWFRKGISSLIINGLGNSSELAVCDDHTMFEIMEGMNKIYSTGISPSLARDIARKAKAETYISGSFQGREDTYWILVNLVNTETGKILWTNKVEGDLKSSGYLDLADSLCNEIKNYLEIKALNETADYEFREAYPKSAEAYRYYIEGMNLVLNQNSESGIRSLKKALEIDSTFTLASFYVAYANCYRMNFEQAILWTKKTYKYKDRVPPKYQLWIEMWYACYESKNIQDITRYCDLLATSGINTRFLWSDLGITYVDMLHQYEKAISAFEKVFEINPERINDWKFIFFWDRYLIALHKTGDHKREREIAEIALKVLPDNSNWVFYRLALCDLSHGNASEANEILVKYREKHKQLGTRENSIETLLGQIYEEAGCMDTAEIHFRRACELNPKDIYSICEYARFLINNNINADKSAELIQKALAINPEDEYALNLKGWSYYKNGKYEEALQLLEQMWARSNGFIFDLYNHLEAAKKAVAEQKRN
jgi:tetratricopeptide (TPR) repeat protein